MLFSRLISYEKARWSFPFTALRRIDRKSRYKAFFNILNEFLSDGQLINIRVNVHQMRKTLI